MEFIIIGAKDYKELVGRIEKIEQTVAREKPQNRYVGRRLGGRGHGMPVFGHQPSHFAAASVGSDDLLFGVEPQILLHVGRNQTGIAGSLRKSK